MRTYDHPLTRLPALAPLWLALIGVLLVGGATAAAADQYFAFGPVLQIDPEDAEDETILDGDLTGVIRPFARVRLYDADSGLLLGEADADVNGIFTVIYEQPSGATPNLEFRVFYLVQDPDTAVKEAILLRPARADDEAETHINVVESAGQFEGVDLKILAEDTLAYAGEPFVSTPGVGLLFTRVGRVETDFIAQNTTAFGGLADFPAGSTAPANLDVPHFRQAPFAGRLFFYGSFGLPSGTGCASQIDYYRVKIEEVGGTFDEYWRQPLFKTASSVTVAPSLSVVHQRQSVGPFGGKADDPDTVPVENDPISHLYWVNRDQIAPITSTFYSFPDLRVNWHTPSFPSGGANGLYKLSLEYYERLSGDVDNPHVKRIDDGCFTTGAPVGEFMVRADNHGLSLSFDHIYLWNPVTSRYFRDQDLALQFGDTADETPAMARALDFNSKGLCEILDLDGKFQVRIHSTISHGGQYLRNYSLIATANDSAKTPVTFFSETYDPDTTATAPLWNNPGLQIVDRGGFENCAYIFDLKAWSRQQNGIDWVQRRHQRRAYYVMQ